MASRSLRALVAALLLSGLASTLLLAVAVSSPTSSVAPSHSSVTLQGACYPMERSVDIFLFCVRSSGLSTRCCDHVVEAAASGGLICLCQIAATPSMAISGYNAVDLLAWYDECGGTAPVDAHLLAKCGATAMSSHIESSARSLPALHSSADKTKKEGDIESENATHASNSAEQTIPSSPDLVNEKSADQNQHSKKVTIMINVQTWHIVVGVVVAVVLLLYGALWVFVRFAAPSPTRDKAKVVLDTITPFLPALLKAALKETEEAALKAAQDEAARETTLKEAHDNASPSAGVVAESTMLPYLPVLLKAAMIELEDEAARKRKKQEVARKKGTLHEGNKDVDIFED